MDTSSLYWLPFRQIYTALQAANHGGVQQAAELLSLNTEWLLEGPSRFVRPNDASAAALRTGGALKAPAWGAKRGVAVDQALVPATLELAAVLVRRGEGVRGVSTVSLGCCSRGSARSK